MHVSVTPSRSARSATGMPATERLTITTVKLTKHTFHRKKLGSRRMIRTASSFVSVSKRSTSRATIRHVSGRTPRCTSAVLLFGPASTPSGTGTDASQSAMHALTVSKTKLISCESNGKRWRRKVSRNVTSQL